MTPHETPIIIAAPMPGAPPTRALPS